MFDRALEKQRSVVQLPPILARLEEIAPCYASLQGRGYEELRAHEQVGKRRYRPSSFVEPFTQELQPHKRCKARRHSKSSKHMARIAPREQPHREPTARMQKSVSLPQLAPSPKPFDEVFAAAKRAVALKKMEVRWSHGAVCERVEATKQEHIAEQKAMVLRHPGRVLLAPLSRKGRLASEAEDAAAASPLSGGGMPKASQAAVPPPDGGRVAIASGAEAQHGGSRGTLATPFIPKDEKTSREIMAEMDAQAAKEHLQLLFEHEWREVLDPSGYSKETAFPVFSMYSRLLHEGDKELDKEELPLVAESCGYMLPKTNTSGVRRLSDVGELKFKHHQNRDLSRIADSITPCSTLSFEEFLKFLKLCAEFEQMFWQETFSKYDKDKSGSICLEELKDVLQDLGYTPMRSMMQGALESVDVDGSGQIDFQEFKVLMKNWRAMEGLTKEEYAELEELFIAFDRNSDGELSFEEQSRLKKYLCLQDDTCQVSHLVQDAHFEIQNVQRLPIVFKGFLAEVRRCREYEIKGFRQLFEEKDADGSGELDISELCDLMRSVGVEPLTKRLKECIKSVDADENGVLNFEEFVHIMWMYRRTEGFTGDELAELQGVFTRFDRDNSGEISTMELGDILRHEGYHPKLDKVQQLCEEFDVDGTGEMGMREFLKLVRRFREAEVKKSWKIFKAYANAETGTMETQELAGVLAELGQDVSMETVVEAVRSIDADGSGTVDWDEFIEWMERYRRLEVRDKRRLCGFSDDQLVEFRAAFDMYDADKSGDIGNSELMRVLTDLNLAPRSEHEQAELLSTLVRCRDLAEELAGKNTFWVFLQLLRDLEDDQDRASLAVERTAMEKAGFSRQEVSEFREIFEHWYTKLFQLGSGCGAAESCKALSAEGVARILRTIGLCLPNVSDHALLEDICRECDFDGNGLVDFPDFLVVMSRLVGSNFRGINEHLSRPRYGLCPQSIKSINEQKARARPDPCLGSSSRGTDEQLGHPHAVSI